MCQDEWLNESVIPSANEKATACVTRRLRIHPWDAPKQTLVEQAEQSVRLAPCGFLSFKRSAFKKSAGIRESRTQ